MGGSIKEGFAPPWRRSDCSDLLPTETPEFVFYSIRSEIRGKRVPGKAGGVRNRYTVKRGEDAPSMRPPLSVLVAMDGD